MDASKKPIETQDEVESVKWKENKMAVVVPATDTSNNFWAHLTQWVTLVEMKPALHKDTRLAFELTKHQAPFMAWNCVKRQIYE